MNKRRPGRPSLERWSPKKFLAALKAAGMNESELAEHLGLSRQAVNQWVHGAAPSIKRLPIVAQMLRVDEQDLLSLRRRPQKSSPR